MDGNLRQVLGEILGEMKGVNQRLDRINGRLDKHEERISKLEAFKSNVNGKITVVSAVIGFIASSIWTWVRTNGLT